VISKYIFVSIIMLFGMQVRANESTLCLPHEEVYFSCPIDKKIMSVCAAGNISPDNGYVKYRFGKMGEIEIEFPKKSFTPRKWFSISDIAGGNLNIRHLKFASGQYQYVLYQGSVSGIYVKKGGKLIWNYVCSPGVYQVISPRAFRGIETVAPISGIDD
jgi:hypothetical protein